MNNLYQALTMITRMGSNPQQIMNTLMKNNPQFNALLNQVKASGMTPQQFLNQYAQQRGIDMNQVQQMAQQLNIRF